MTLHFLKRDFLDCRMSWIILLIFTILGVLSPFAHPVGVVSIPFIFLAYLLFPNIFMSNILGSVWRTQHQLSRHYLLSLPLLHRKLFRIQQVRILVLWIPFLTLACLLPLIGYVASGPLSVGLEMWFFYYFGLFTSVMLFIHINIWMTLEMERISSYLPKRERIWAFIKMFVVMGGLIAILVFAWENLFYRAVVSIWPASPLRESPFSLIIENIYLARVGFPSAFIVLLIFIRHNTRRWCVTF